MIVLDTDHINVLQNQSGAEYAALAGRMAASADQQFVTTAVTLDEQMRGWLALIHRWSDPHRQVLAYAKLNGMVDYYSRWVRLSFDERAADLFRQLRSRKVRVSTMDPKIAAMTLVHGALLLSANLRDFQQVPSLRVENLLHGGPAPPTARTRRPRTRRSAGVPSVRSGEDGQLAVGRLANPSYARSSST